MILRDPPVVQGIPKRDVASVESIAVGFQDRQHVLCPGSYLVSDYYFIMEHFASESFSILRQCKPQ